MCGGSGSGGGPPNGMYAFGAPPLFFSSLGFIISYAFGAPPLFFSSLGFIISCLVPDYCFLRL
jgi:hypothetical protein